jgi:predicted NBD/HSP70 family sugar kinase
LISSLTTPQPVDFADVRATNLAVVLRYVRGHAPCSRADIAAATGLNKATVSSLVTDLLERRLVRETGLTENRIGRPATMLVLDGSSYAAIGLEVNADYLTAVALDLAGTRLLSWRRSFAGLNVSPGKAVAAVTALARRALAKVTKESRSVLGMTVGVPGLVDPAGVVRVAPNLGWHEVDLRGQLASALGDPPDAFPVSVDNDANLAATAEHRWGAYAGTPNLAYLTGAVGIGAGVITDGRLLRGAHGFTGELGHVQLDPAGPECGCGRRGCLEALAGVAGLLRRASPDSFAEGTPSDWEPEIAEVARRARAQDKVTLDALAEVGTWLGQGAAVLANVVNPEVIILGGYFVPLAQWLLPAAQEELSQRALAPDAGGARLVASTFGHDAAATGGAATILAAVDAGNLPRPAGARR